MILDLADPVDAADHVRGTAGRRQLVVYGDFECPYTRAAMSTMSDLLGSGPPFQLVFRHFPLVGIHPHAQAAAAASEAAARQGRFWEMHDLLFANQRHLEPDDLSRQAERLGLDLERFAADEADPAIAARVARDVESGERSGVEGTPSLFVDGVLYRGPRDRESLARALA